MAYTLELEFLQSGYDPAIEAFVAHADGAPMGITFKSARSVIRHDDPDGLGPRVRFILDGAEIDGLPTGLQDFVRALDAAVSSGSFALDAVDLPTKKPIQRLRLMGMRLINNSTAHAFKIPADGITVCPEQNK